MAKILYLYTKSFPYGKGETFLENEFPYLVEEFDKVMVIPLYKQGEIRDFKYKFNVINIDLKGYSSFKLIFYKGFSFLRIFIDEVIKENKNKAAYRKNFSEYRSYLLQQFHRANELKRFLYAQDDDESIHYSFWTEEWSIVLGILRMQGILKNEKLISRVHGFDLFTERRKHGVIPFRFFQLKKMDAIVAVSQAGFNYLSDNYSGYSRKFHLFRLGVHDNGINPFNPEKKFTIVSCANIIPLKRIELIPDILSGLNFPVKWIHLGDGEIMGVLKEKINSISSRVEVELRGHVSNHEVLATYQNESINLAILLSETEGGVPVALQEAISFGVPVLGTDVGGVPEVVNEKTGILINRDFNISEAQEAISSFRDSKLNTMMFRNGVKDFWKAYFDARNNYSKFIKFLLR